MLSCGGDVSMPSAHRTGPAARATPAATGRALVERRLPWRSATGCVVIVVAVTVVPFR
jgi:hypothetical protein